ncbi:MAG: hypothetical protein HQL94_04525, partial [Magnetococcales bacterium]|nr:hypothetical protein [Magnetococcales bacterium]
LYEEGERFLLDEYKNQRKIEGWQVAQKLAAFYIDQGNMEKAETWVDLALAGNEENPFNHYLRGLLHHSGENWEEATASYEQAETLSDRFRDQEKAYMVDLVADALQRARNRQPMEEEGEVEEEEEMEQLDLPDVGVV